MAGDPRSDANRTRLITVLAVACIGLLGVLGLDGSRPEVQAFTVTALVGFVGVAVWARGAALRHPPVTAGFLVGVYGLHLVGSVLRWLVIQWFYGGLSDAVVYLRYGSDLSPAFRSLNFPPFPQAGTEAMGWFSGLVFAITGDSLMAGYVVCTTLAFFGAWFFYRAFCLAFPQGDKRLFALLIFLLPSMWYWPASLGKDAVVLFFLGVSVYGVASVLAGRLLPGIVAVGIGTAGVLAIRPPLATVPLIAGACALVVQPARVRSVKLQLAVWILVTPVLLLLLNVALNVSTSYVGDRSFTEAYERQVASDFGSRGADSNFQPPDLFAPTGIPSAMMTANLRPFPWEAGGLLPAVASLETVFVLLFAASRWRSVARAVYRWKDNPMTVFVLSAWVGMSIILSSLGNFGLLARQRTQVLPFLLMLLVAVADNGRGPIARRHAEPVPAEVQ